MKILRKTHAHGGKCKHTHFQAKWGQKGCVCISLHVHVFPSVLSCMYTTKHFLSIFSHFFIFSFFGDGWGDVWWWWLWGFGCFEGVSMSCAFSFPIINQAIFCFGMRYTPNPPKTPSLSPSHISPLNFTTKTWQFFFCQVEGNQK